MEWFVARRRLRKFQTKTLCFTALPEDTVESIKPNLRRPQSKYSSVEYEIYHFDCFIHDNEFALRQLNGFQSEFVLINCFKMLHFRGNAEVLTQHIFNYLLQLTGIVAILSAEKSRSTCGQTSSQS